MKKVSVWNAGPAGLYVKILCLIILRPGGVSYTVLDKLQGTQGIRG